MRHLWTSWEMTLCGKPPDPAKARKRKTPLNPSGVFRFKGLKPYCVGAAAAASDWRRASSLR